MNVTKQINKLIQLKTKIILAVFAMPALLIVALPAIDFDRQLASVQPLKNWGLTNAITNSHIHALEAWKIEEGSKNVVVAVVDTGIDPNHEDLKNNLWKDPVTGNYGYDFVENKPNPKDEHGHGTHVSGILGATLNAKSGVSGVAHKVSIMPIRYYSEKNTGSENLKNSIKALNWAIDHGAKIINYSGGGPEYSKEEYETIKKARDKGVLIVAAAGNEHQNADLPQNYYYPCAYRMENIVCVAAINIRNELLASSNFGKKMVDVVAPGENILSTVPGGKYSYMTGTSQATAFVTGMVALMLAHDPKLKPSDVREILNSTVDKIENLKDKIASGGKVNAALALAQIDRKRKVEFKPVAIRSSEKTTRPARTISSPDQLKAALKERNLF